MKKLFTLFAAVVAALAMNATIIEFTPTDFEGQGTESTGSAVSATKDGVTVSCDKAFGHNLALRCYKNSVLTISSSETINSLVFQFYSTYTGSLNNSISVNASTWTNTMGAQARIESIKVYINETPVIAAADTITVSQARALIDASTGLTDKHYIYGIITNIANTDAQIAQYHNCNVYMRDLVNVADTMEMYKSLGLNGAAYNSLNDVPFVEGDTVMFVSTLLKKYNSTYETEGAYYVETLGGSEQADKIKVDFTTANAIASESDNISFNLTGANASLVINEWETSYAWNNKAMAGTYDFSAAESVTLTVNGAAVTLVSGSLSVEFVDINADGSQNQYKFKLNATSQDNKQYYSDNTIWATVLDDNESAYPMINDNTNIDVQMAINICEQTGQTATTTLYNVYGYVASIKTAYDEGYKNSTFYMSDDPNATSGVFLAYRAKSDAALPVGSFVRLVQTNLINYSGNTPETNNLPKAEIIDAASAPIIRHGVAPVYDTIPATVDEALAAGNALAQNQTTEDYYEIDAYVISAYDPDEKGEQTWYMADEQGETSKDKEIMVQFTKADQTIEAGQYVKVIGKVLHYYKAATETASAKEYITIRNAYAKVIYGTAIENVEAAAKATKMVKNGQLIIEKNGVKFNVLGAKL